MTKKKEWAQRKRTVTMTNDEWVSLYNYLFDTSRHIDGEQKAWERLAKEKKEDGSAKFHNAAGNAEYYRQTRKKLAGWLAKIDWRGTEK